MPDQRKRGDHVRKDNSYLGFPYERGARGCGASRSRRGQAGAEAVQAVEIGQGSLPVSLAAMVNINALACDLRKTVDQRVRNCEISLLLSYIIGDQGKGPLGVECSAFDSSAGHIQRFISECTPAWGSVPREALRTAGNKGAPDCRCRIDVGP
ncbi:hypothetical protein [Streptomyces hawaiiensis]|uniref:hypothetical protein n=1 Tax=Streptomyces hawaiiensis TaxID=67305 RepID=UPI00365BA972